MLKTLITSLACTLALVTTAPARELSPVAFLLAYGQKPAPHKARPRHNRQRHHGHRARFSHHGRIRAMVAASARAHGVPLRLALGVARVESGFRPRWNGIAAGVMQIRPATARSVGCSGAVHDLMRPAYGIECGMRYLAQIVRHTSSRRLAAARYTQGIGARRISRRGAHYAALVLAQR